MTEKKGLKRVIALGLIAAAVLQMVSVAFVKPNNKK